MKTFLLSVAFTLLTCSGVVVAQSKQDPKASTTIKTDKRTDSVYYSCPKHPFVKLNEKGKCPMCSRILEKKTVRTSEIRTEKHEAMDSYVCPMHPRMKSHKPRKCPKCGMNLVKK